MTAYLIRRIGTSIAAFTTYAMPDFFLYLIAIQVFALSLPIFSFEASQLLQVHAVLGDGHPGLGLHQDGAGQGPAGAACR